VAGDRPRERTKEAACGVAECDFSVTELSERHGVSRKTAYKWIGRYKAEGPDGLLDRSRRPQYCPQATRPDVLADACRLRMSRRTPGLVKKRRKSRKQPHQGRPTAPFDAPNSIWSLGRLSRLSVWGIELGILPDLIETKKSSSTMMAPLPVTQDCNPCGFSLCYLSRFSLMAHCSYEPRGSHSPSRSSSSVATISRTAPSEMWTARMSY